MLYFTQLFIARSEDPNAQIDRYGNRTKICKNKIAIEKKYIEAVEPKIQNEYLSSFYFGCFIYTASGQKFWVEETMEKILDSFS